jgi:Fe-S cluster assembly scaffold protein SufB
MAVHAHANVAGRSLVVTHDDVDRLVTLTREPAWLSALRHRALEAFHSRPLPTWVGDLSVLEIGRRDVVPEALADPPDPLVTAERGVIVTPLPRAVIAHESLVRESFGSLVPPEDNAVAALTTAICSGGWFVFVPSGVDVGSPITLPPSSASTPAGRFERTLVVVGEGARVHLRETLTGRDLTSGTVHGAVTEVLVAPGGHCRFTSIQRLPAHAVHLATRRASADTRAMVRWDDAHVGAHLAMQYPSVYLRGRGAEGEVVSAAVAGEGQHHDVGAKLVFEAPEGRGRMVLRALSLSGGRTTRRALVRVARGALGAVCRVDDASFADGPHAICAAHPYIEIDERDAVVERAAPTPRALAAVGTNGDRVAERVRHAAFMVPVLEMLDDDAGRTVREALG